MRACNGFVIPLVLLLISIITVLVIGIYQRGSTFVPYMNVVIKREQAKMLALSGVQVAMSQLAQPRGFDEKQKPDERKDQQKQAAQQPSAQQQAKDLLFELLPTLNQWQTFALKKSIDGIDGKIQIALSSEDGKIDINNIYDFTRRRFVGEGQTTGDWKKVMQYVCKQIQKKMKISEDLFESFEKFLKQRHYKVNDATELLPLDAFKQFARTIFYAPPKTKNESDRPFYLLDIFTVYGSQQLQPWLLSDSIRGIFQMKRVEPIDEKKKKEMIEEVLKKFSLNITIAKDWNTLFQPLYGIELKRLFKGIEPLFASSFDPRIFSVVSYGVIGDMTQRVFAVLERVRHVDKAKTWYDVKVRKLYWI